MKAVADKVLSDRLSGRYDIMLLPERSTNVSTGSGVVDMELYKAHRLGEAYDAVLLANGSVYLVHPQSNDTNLRLGERVEVRWL